MQTVYLTARRSVQGSGPCCKRAAQQFPTSGDPSACLQLVSFPPTQGSSLSSTPFGGKLEVAMRLAGLKYEAYAGKVTDPKTAPKKKVRSSSVPHVHPAENLVYAFCLAASFRAAVVTSGLPHAAWP